MRTIRSVLWVGSGEGLAKSGVTEAPELDITWVRSLEEAAGLPAVRFEGVLFEVEDDPKELEIERALSMLERFASREIVLLALSSKFEHTSEALLSLGIGAILLINEDSEGHGLVNEINATLDSIADQKSKHAKTCLGTPLAPGSASSPAPSPPTDPSRRMPNLSEAPNSDVPTTNAAGMISKSEPMQNVLELVELAASSPSTVLVTGETGVGKEVVARQLHARGCRDEEPFLAINCAAFPEHLLESELFGHTRGAFTGADRSKPGLFEAAGRGTLFLDEIAETSLTLQSKLLRVLQEREVRAVGATQSRPIHCRIVAATNRVLSDEVRLGTFREDLFYRLNVFPIGIPPLRERRPDILPLAREFLTRHGPREGKVDCHFSLATCHLLEAYAWPGNVRELENEVLRMLMLTPSGQLITPRRLSPKLTDILEPIAAGARPEETLRQALDRIECWLLRRALTNNDGRKALTARKLGLTREGLYKKLKRLGIG
jgi:DNA-binding NtrC family response regulator